jgi:TonB family protein
MTDSHAASAKSQSVQPSSIRLVIRARIIPDEPARTTEPQPSHKGALAVIVGTVAVLALIWIGISIFRSGSEIVEPQPPAPETASSAATPVVGAEPTPTPAATNTERTGPVAPESRAATAVQPEVRDERVALSPPINEVLPNPSRSALDTIRGTIIVSVRVTIDKQGKVTAAVAEDPGPSRYFERLSVAAAKKWILAPVNSDEPRTMLLRFHFTREGTTALVDK